MGKTVDPNELHGQLSTIDGIENFGDGHQHDAHEFLIKFVAHLARSHGPVEQEMAMDELFRFAIVRSTICSNCSHESLQPNDNTSLVIFSFHNYKFFV